VADAEQYMTMLADLRSDADFWELTPTEQTRWVARLSDYNDRRLYRLIERSYELERRATCVLSALPVAAFAVGIAVAVLHG
jgi:hypothetical protein